MGDKSKSKGKRSVSVDKAAAELDESLKILQEQASVSAAMINMESKDDPHDTRSEVERWLDDSKREWASDLRVTKPGLHMLYTTTAVRHLRALDECICRLQNFSNLNMMDAVQALFTERLKLVTTQSAYAQAQAILESLGITHAHQIVELE